MNTTLDLTQDFIEKREKYNKELLTKQIKDFTNQVEYKTNLLNIDSRFRNKIPKNIYTSNNILLPNNPIYTFKDSNIIKIYYPNHQFKIGNRIIIQNVIGNTKTLTNCIYLFNNFQYMIINFPNHNVTTDFINYNNTYQILINIINDIGNKTLYGNIPVNGIAGIFDITLASIINQDIPLSLEILRVLNVNSVYDLDKDYLLVKLPFGFVISGSSYMVLDDVFKISFLSIGGISLTNINADFPINYQRYQGYQEIIDSDQYNIWIQVPMIASNYENSGGDKIQIMLVTKTLEGFPDANNYMITLKRNFNNVVRIELVSSEFPYIDFLITSSGNNINNKLYWKHYDDGNYIYQATIPEGNYDSNSLISTISVILNQVPKINSSIENPIYNIFDVSIDSFTQEIKFTAYKENKLPNSILASLVDINNVKYVKLTISHKGNLVEKSDIIQIYGSSKIGTIIDANLINNTHTVYDVNVSEQTYSILLAPLNQITNLSTIDLTGNGGPSIIIKTKTKVSFLFNKSDTIGNILGFKNVGEANAITPFKTTISNFDNYIQSTILNQIGNIDVSTKILNLSGNNYYILMYLNDYECVLNSFNQPASFAKILMSGSPNDILFNTFINFPYEFDFPIPSLNELNIKFTYPDGNLVDFRNIDHSFTLRIIEKIIKPYNTGLNSKDISIIDSIKQNK
jgi:hypothetical protein